MTATELTELYEGRSCNQTTRYGARGTLSGSQSGTGGADREASQAGRVK